MNVLTTAIYLKGLDTMIHCGDFIITVMKMSNVKEKDGEMVVVGNRCEKRQLELFSGFVNMLELPWKTMHVASEEFSSREVVKTNQFCQCRLNDVKDISYVFHARDIDSGKHNVIGKENVFTMRC